MLFPGPPRLDPPPGQPKAVARPETPENGPETPRPSEGPVEFQPEAGAPTVSRRELWVEMGAVLSLSYFVWLFGALVPLSWVGEGEASPFLGDMVFSLVYDLQIVLPLVFILARGGEPWSRFGLGRPWWVHDTMVGLVIFLALIFLPKRILHLLLSDVYPGWLRALEHEAQGDLLPLPVGPGEHALLVIALFVGALAEELVFRGYLIPRLRQLGTGVVSAVLVSSALFASIHLYQGYWSTGLHLVEGFIFGALFLVAGRLWPVVIAHTLFNLNVYDWADAGTDVVSRGLFQV